MPIGAGAPSFGVEDFTMVPEEEGGGVDMQAGSHPYQLTTTFELNQSGDPAAARRRSRATCKFNLPPGLVGNATLLPQCSDLDFRHVVNRRVWKTSARPTPSSAWPSVTVDEPINLQLSTKFPVPLFNLVPEKGEPARFGFEAASAPVTLDTAVRTGSDYGVVVNVTNITQLVNFISSTVTFWGVPGDQSHDSARGWSCLVGGHWTPHPRANCPASRPVRARPTRS